MPFIKAAAITNLADARYFASHGAKMMGFCFNPKSVNYIQPYKMQEISGWLQGPELVGEFDNLSFDAITDLVQSLKLQYAQIPLSQIEKELYADIAVPIIIEVQVNYDTLIDNQKLALLTHVYKNNDWVLLQLHTLTANDLNNQTLISSIKKITSKFPTIIDYAFTKENINFFLQNFHAEGLALSGLPETKIGTKNFESLNELMELLIEND